MLYYNIHRYLLNYYGQICRTADWTICLLHCYTQTSLHLYFERERERDGAVAPRLGLDPNQLGKVRLWWKFQANAQICCLYFIFL